MVARGKHQQGFSPQPELIEQIRQLYDQVDLTSLGKRSIDIASELLYSAPDLAIDMVEKANTADQGENSLDWAFAALSVAALTGIDNVKPGSSSVFENISSKIQDPKARQFASESSVLLGEYSAQEVVKQAEKIEGDGKRLYWLRIWCEANQNREDTAPVVEYALNLAVATTGFAPNAQVFRELSMPLPYIDDVPKLRSLVSLIDSQKGEAETKGPSEEYVRLQLLLARAEHKFDQEVAQNRIIETYLYISGVGDIVVKGGCLAQLVNALIEIDPERQFETRDQLHSLTLDDLGKAVTEILSVTADHYQSLSGVIRSVGKRMPQLVHSWCISLNAENRRDAALHDLVEVLLDAPDDTIDLGYVQNLLPQICAWDIRDNAKLKIIERVSKEGTPDSVVQIALPVFNSVGEIGDTEDRCRAYCLAHIALKQNENEKLRGLAEHLLGQLNESWLRIDVGWLRVDTGYKIIASLAPYSNEVAKHYLEETQNLQKEIQIDSQATAYTYVSCLRLATRAFSGLLYQHLDTVQDMDRVAHLIENIPSKGERAVVWADIALKFFCNRRTDDGNEIVTNRVKPLLQDISDDDKAYRYHVIIRVSPALYMAHKATALQIISELPQPTRDEAYQQVCRFKFCKQSPNEPYEETSGKGYEIPYNDIIDICEIMKLMDRDGIIYRNLKDVAYSTVPGRGSARVTVQQKQEIIRRLEEIVDAKLPNLRYIQHKGFLIASHAELNRMKQVKDKDWDDLIETARQIPNLADRAYVLSLIAIALRRSDPTKFKDTLEDANAIIKIIPSIVDKAEHYQWLGSMALEVDSTISKEYLRLAMQTSMESNDPDLYPIQRRTIDLAYRLDADFASSLVSLTDDDPVRGDRRKLLNRRLQTLELKKNTTLAPGKEMRGSKPDYSQVAWEKLGALNANRAPTVHLSQTNDYVRLAAGLPLSKAYPIYAWVIENANKRFYQNEEANRGLRGIFEASLLTVETAIRIVSRSASDLRQALSYSAPHYQDTSSILVKAGDRENALQFIKNWFEHEVAEYIKICDPFFGLEDLPLLQVLLSVNPTIEVSILTSRKHQLSEKITAPWSKAYTDYWNLSVSSHNPPDTKIVIVGSEGKGESPIHDRWWLTKGKGLRMGTSFNSLGNKKESEISVLTREETERNEHDVDQFLLLSKREHLGERLKYETFTL